MIYPRVINMDIQDVQDMQGKILDSQKYQILCILCIHVNDESSV